MAHIKVNNISMYYEVHGEGEPLVFIAGFTADHTVWGEVIDRFKKSYQAIVFDNRGAGQTDIPEGPYSIELMAEDVVALCAELGVKKASFVGNSMGGFIAQILAYHHPELVKSLVISHSAPVMDTSFRYFVEAQLELLQAKVPAAPWIKVLNSWCFSPRFLSQPGMMQELIQLALDNPYPFTVKGYERQLPALLEFDSRAWLQHIKAPVLVLGSDQDLIFSESLATYLTKHISGARYHRFSECGHLPQIEYPEEYSRVIQEFIERI